MTATAILPLAATEGAIHSWECSQPGRHNFRALAQLPCCLGVWHQTAESMRQRSVSRPVRP